MARTRHKVLYHLHQGEKWVICGGQVIGSRAERRVNIHVRFSVRALEEKSLEVNLKTR